MKTDPERWLKLFLRFVGAMSLLALFAVVLPASWLADIHDLAGLPGRYAAAPITDYLARSTSIFYAVLGGLFLLAACDVRRYRALIVYLAAALFVVGVTLTVVDLAHRFPWWWVLGEFLCAIPVAAIMLVLLRRVPQTPNGDQDDA
jgi:surface polysaccharide O-acyltransferase-like enzyme